MVLPTPGHQENQMIEAKIILDSEAPSRARLTTFELTYPRFIHSEVMTHRQFSRNASSSRAIPIEAMIARTLNDPAGPVWWGKNQKGMQAEEALSPQDTIKAINVWIQASHDAVIHARHLLG
jgi:hypothetical protein